MDFTLQERPMRLNVYVPKQKMRIVQALDEAKKRTGKAKNEIVLAALESYLSRSRPELGVFHLGKVDLPPRDELYVGSTVRD
jgi:hypothetical protein